MGRRLHKVAEPARAFSAQQMTNCHVAVLHIEKLAPPPLWLLPLLLKRLLLIVFSSIVKTYQCRTWLLSHSHRPVDRVGHLPSLRLLLPGQTPHLYWPCLHTTMHADSEEKTEKAQSHSSCPLLYTNIIHHCAPPLLKRRHRDGDGLRLRVRNGDGNVLDTRLLGSCFGITVELQVFWLAKAPFISHARV